MNLVDLNRIVLLVLMGYCIYTVFMFNKKLSSDIKISENKLELVYLEKEEKQLEIDINKKILKKVEIKD